ncbi:hypothetical protein FRX31_005169 [Thalictrum thalictroides]|uniref:Uncharacterized protein n=1 Tax=Thalictrum thalictroides TaxID=46969 RepID=A0A7J6X6C1_THATH|nr:hypothetical protein FRX31_005169 [Thalictrum thalictroides]
MDPTASLGNVHPGAEQTSNDILQGETSAALPNRRGPSRGPLALPGGKKRFVSTNELGQPNGSDVDSMVFKTTIGVNTRKYVPIAYETFHLVPPEDYENVLSVLQETFDCEGVSPEYFRDRVNQAWKNHRHNLHKKYIKGKLVAVLRNSPPPPFVNREEWKWFLDYTSKETFKAASRRNIVNRSKLKAPNTLGRRTMAAIRHMIVLGKDRNGHMRGMGAGISITMVKKTSTLLKKNEVLQAENSTTNLKVDMLGKELEKIKEMILKTQVNSPTTPSKHSSQPDHPFLNKQYDLYAVGSALVGSGEVVEVDPQVIVHGTPLGEGSYKILLTDAHDKNASYFFQKVDVIHLGKDFAALHPVVHGQALKYNLKVRAGRGFSLEELKAKDRSMKSDLMAGSAEENIDDHIGSSYQNQVQVPQKRKRGSMGGMKAGFSLQVSD